jgi:hypothetical protein
MTETEMIIKQIGDFKIKIQNDRSFFLRRPAYRIWISGENLKVNYVVSAEIVVKKNPEKDAENIRSTVKYFENIISDHYANTNKEYDELLAVVKKSEGTL